MDFYAELSKLVAQIPRGRVSYLVDIALALGDRGATRSLPRALLKIRPRCEGAYRAVKADGSILFPDASSSLIEEDVDVARSKVVNPDVIAFRRFRTEHPLARLRAAQIAMAKRVRLRDAFKKPRIVAGVDASYEDDHCIAVAVAVEMESLGIVAQSVVETDVDFPYIPGYLAYRELPPMVRAIKRLRIKPDVLMVDGHGVLHPAEFGIASHIGVSMGVPTIGVGKSHLVGEIDSRRIDDGDAAAVRIEGRVLGYALWASHSTRPIYVSPGNMISPRTAVEITRMTCKGRMSLPIRYADAIAREKKREKSGL